MLKRPITYENYNGVEVTEDYYFNLSKPELMRLEASEKGGFGAMLKKLAESDDNAGVLKQYERLIISAYGVKTEDGRLFEKSDEIHDEFMQTAAYEQLFDELSMDPNKLMEFVVGTFPKDMRGDITKALETEFAKDQAKTEDRPLPPGSPT